MASCGCHAAHVSHLNQKGPCRLLADTFRAQFCSPKPRFNPILAREPPELAVAVEAVYLLGDFLKRHVAGSAQSLPG